MVESPPADAGDAGSCPGLGGSHMPRSGWAREPWPLSLCVRSLCSAAGEAKLSQTATLICYLYVLRGKVHKYEQFFPTKINV